jgi:hypothetical protein
VIWIDIRLVDFSITKSARRNAAENGSERRALLLDGHRLVQVLVAKVLHSGSQVTEEDWHHNQILIVLKYGEIGTYRRSALRLPQQSQC